jgi:hypothetical protein
MARRLSGLSKTDLVNFLFQHCQARNSWACITEAMLKKAGIDDLDRARWAIVHGNNPRLFGRLARLAKGVDKRQESIDAIWQFCLARGFNKYFGREVLEAQKDQVIWTAHAAIKHESFPRLISWLLQQHRHQTH